MSVLGKQVRLGRLFNNPSGKILVIALDHAIGWGVIPGIENIQETLDTVVSGGPDAVTMLKGTAEKCFSNHAGKVGFILKCTTFAPFHPAYDAWVAQVDEGVRLGADAVAMGVTVGGRDQIDLLQNLGRFTREADMMGMPVATHIYPKGDLIDVSERYSVKNVAYAARAAAELGVDIIKTFYTGDTKSFTKVVKAAAPARVVVSGGPKLDSLEEVFKMTRDAMDAGAAGVTYGRNVWQAGDPVRVMKGLKSILHNNKDVKDAMAIVGGGA